MFLISEGKKFAIPEDDISTPLQAEILARKFAWQTVFQKVEFVGDDSPERTFFRKTFAECHLASNLLLSDAADYGIGAVKNAYASRKRKIRSALALENAFFGIPAIIAGAGPSLPSLKGFQDRALIFAGGATLDRIDVKPHFAAAIDKEGPLKKKIPGDVPFCFQSRLNYAVLSQVQGPLLRAPESHFPFLRWLEGEENAFDGGWTVGNFLVSLATLWGCNPIILVGMDFCYKEGKKYKEDDASSDPENLISVKNLKGEEVFTQNDWLMALHWMNEWAKLHPNQNLFDGCGEGIGFEFPIKKLEDLDLSPRQGLRERVQALVREFPFLKNSEKRWRKWKEELEDCGPIVEEKLLEHLWHIWRSVFAREVKREEEIAIHQKIFYEQVRKEHLYVFD